MCVAGRVRPGFNLIDFTMKAVARDLVETVEQLIHLLPPALPL